MAFSCVETSSLEVNSSKLSCGQCKVSVYDKNMFWAPNFLRHFAFSEPVVENTFDFLPVDTSGLIYYHVGTIDYQLTSYMAIQYSFLFKVPQPQRMFQND